MFYLDVLSREDLIAMERRAGRPQDRGDADALERVAGLGEGGADVE